jgi:hypothetical protein
MRALPRAVVACVVALGAAACATTVREPRGAAPAHRGATAEPSPGDGTGSERAASSSPIDLHYQLRVDAGLKTLHARLCVRGAPPGELVSGMRGGAEAIEAAWAESEPAPRPLAIERNAIVADGVPADGCLGYRLDLGRATDVGGMDAVRREDVVVMNTSLWLVRPRRFERVRSIRVELELPDGMRASAPWPLEGRTLVPDPSALAYSGHAVVGRYDSERFDEAGARFEVAIPHGLSPTTRAAIVPWLRTAAAATASVTGRAPAERVLVVVVPDASDDDRPVRFGTVARGGGASLLLFVPRDAALDALRTDWVAVHELSHLFHPFIDRREAWLSEGLATYYQEVLRVRAGLLTEQEAFRRLAEGAARGAGAEHSLAVECEQMFVSFEFARVYWGGAAFALLADVELRRRTGGARSLDDVVAGIHACCSRNGRPWSAREVLARMDELAGVPVFGELAERYVYRKGFPDIAPVLRELGVTVDAAGVRLDAAAPGAGMRAAIMGGAKTATAP